MLPAEQLGDLDRVERGALPQIVGDAPEVEAVLDGRVLADAADVGGIFADRLDRRDVSAVLALVYEHDAGRLAEDVLRFLGGNLALELDVDRFRMPDEDGDADAGRRHFDL